MNILRFTDGPTRYEAWELPDAGWEDWASTVDRFLAHAIRGIAAEYQGDSVEWLEVNYWQSSGWLIVFPSQFGPMGDRGERVCFELSSKYLEGESRRVSNSIPESERDATYERQASSVWHRVSECLTVGEASRELFGARNSHKLRVAGYDFNPGEGPVRLDESGELI